MTFSDFLSYPVLFFQSDDSSTTRNTGHRQRVGAYEEQIVGLELALTELDQHYQPDGLLIQMDESVEAHYASLRHHYAVQLERAYRLRKSELMGFA